MGENPFAREAMRIGRNGQSRGDFLATQLGPKSGGIDGLIRHDDGKSLC